MTKFHPKDGTRFQRLLSVTMSGGARRRKSPRLNFWTDCSGFVLVIGVFVLIWVATP